MKFPLLPLLLLLSLPLQAQELSVEHIRQHPLQIAPGQYSGITHVSEDIYAVVHDKAVGGGIFFFTIGFNADGTIGPVTAFETDAGGPKGRDNEDIVYVPETQTLFVAAEGDQSIREYYLNGAPTGRQLRIPAPLLSPKANAGFESLAYRDGTFWTTTESPIPGETLHRLQSFRLSDLSPGKTYYYRADEPSVPASEVAAAQAYVIGIPALTALPDGRLLVLEREVYVPKGGLLDMLKSFTRCSLFVTDPLHDDSRELRKTLLTTFYTTFMDMANFEGMCLGPLLPDGRQTLLLLADSQDGSQGLTAEYIRVLALDIR